MNFIELKVAMSAAEKKLGLDALDWLAKDILFAIAYENLNKRKIHNTALLKQDRFGTLPTVISRIQLLEKTGWIEGFSDPDDRRITLLKITPKAQVAIKKMSKMIDTAFGTPQVSTP